MAEISAVVLTKNEENDIGPCLETLQWADEVLVLDSFSDDATLEIAKRMGADVHQHRFVNFPSQRNIAIGLASKDWLLFVDADERVTTELAEEVRRVSAQGEVAGWWVPRRNYIFGKWIRHAGWFPDYQLRLFRRSKGRYDERREVHELVELQGEAGYLQNAMVHYNYTTVREFCARQDLYTDYEARMDFEKGERTKLQNLVFQPLRHFRWRYLTLQGYKDGWHGLLLSLLMAYYEFVRYRKLLRLPRR